MNESFDITIKEGLRFLARHQEADGSFFCLVTEKPDDYSFEEKCPAIVPSNIVLSSLSKLPGTSLVESIKQKTASFLLSQKGDYWSFNYWFRNSEEYVSLPYPDDLDDTFCALAALYEYNPGLFDGEAMARIATMLTSAEKNEGGPYDMWLVSPDGRDTWNDTDLVVNSNIAYFLSLQDIHLPGLDAFIDESIKKENYIFPYYTPYPALYFISRFYSGTRKQEMIDYILARRDSAGIWNNPLQTALAVLALLNLSKGALVSEVTPAISYLQKTQFDGGWQPYSFFFQMRNQEKTVYAGSATITTAFCLEALQVYFEYTQLQSEHETEETSVAYPEADMIHTSIIDCVYTRFEKSDEYLKAAAGRCISNMLESDRDRTISLLPYIFKQALGQRGKSLSNGLVIKLGTANVHGWNAYTVYDNFLDRIGEPEFLSVAHMSLRESVDLFQTALPKSPEFARYTKKVFDAIDAANTWEMKFCRYKDSILSREHLPDFGDLSRLADKSFGYALGPLALLFALGFTEVSDEFNKTKNFFKHYIIARQLNDDIHDWEDDVRAGCITVVVAQIIKDSDETGHSIENMRRTFWHTSVLTMCSVILDHIKQAEMLLASMPFLEKDGLASLLKPITQSISKTVEEHTETVRFMQAFHPAG